MELGGDGRVFGKTEDEYECARECRADEQCQGFLFITKNFPNEAQHLECHFKWDFGSPHTPLYTYPGIKAGYESCRNDYNLIEGKLHFTTKPTIHFPYFLIECEFRAVDIPKAQVEGEFLHQDIADEKACARLCQQDINCDFFVYLTEETDYYKNCVLKFGILDGAEVIEGPGLLSSYRTCRFTLNKNPWISEPKEA